MYFSKKRLSRHFLKMPKNDLLVLAYKVETKDSQTVIIIFFFHGHKRCQIKVKHAQYKTVSIINQHDKVFSNSLTLLMHKTEVKCCCAESLLTLFCWCRLLRFNSKATAWPLSTSEKKPLQTSPDRFGAAPALISGSNGAAVNICTRCRCQTQSCLVALFHWWPGGVTQSLAVARAATSVWTLTGCHSFLMSVRHLRSFLFTFLKVQARG